MEWEELKEKIYFPDGGLRDIYIQDTDKEDWKLWVDFVNENYRVEFHNYVSDEINDKIDYDTILNYWKGDTDSYSTARIFLDKIQLNVYFFTEYEIDSDFNPGKFKTMEDHTNLITYLAKVSILLRKEVFVASENNPDLILMQVNDDIVTHYFEEIRE